jgi:hypothetical protein
MSEGMSLIGFRWLNNPSLRLALAVALLGHGLLLPFTFETTYDAYVHIFFAHHYAHHWFELWDNRWYTGFAVSSYPPLVHQLIALFSFIGGLKFGFLAWAILALLCLVVGAYRFSRLFVSEKIAGYAAVTTVFCPAIIQALHLYGQLPTLTGIAFLLNALPDLYAWIRWGSRFGLGRGLALIAVTVASHHVTPLFGMVFFVAPLVGVAVFDQSAQPLATIKSWLMAFWRNRFRISVVFTGIVTLLVVVIFPYWQWSSANPITQVSIPHGSRDSYVNVSSSGLMFFLIPYGFVLLILPALFRYYFTPRNFLMGLSLSLLVLLGTGGTTPLPSILLGKNAFEILTLDRFTFWAVILCIPFVARWLAQTWERKQRFVFVVSMAIITAQTVYVVQLGRFRTLQPAKINMQPIVDFLATDQHSRWRYMTLGFGDQMAWLSALTDAQSVDGNYHSARRLPELTAYPIERLENAKHRGLAGIQSLQQFIYTPEKYALKYIFSNDKFYDPLLYFTGWERVIRLANGVVVWERPDVPPLSSGVQKPSFPLYQRILWGSMPLLCLLVLLSVVLYGFFRPVSVAVKPLPLSDHPLKPMPLLDIGWVVLLSGVLGFSMLKSNPVQGENTDEGVLRAYLNDLDFRYVEQAYRHFSATRPSYEEYLLQLSTTDGLVASYSKLDSVQTTRLTTQHDTALVSAHLFWRTALGQYSETKAYRLVNENSQWKLIYPISASSIPPDRTLESAALVVFSHGKRRVSAEPAPADDILDRPELAIQTANLVKHNGAFAIVGTLRNTDHLPASVRVEGLFYDNHRRLIGMAQTRLTSVYAVMPQEEIPFRIDFEGKAIPADFALQARAVVTTQPIYRGLGWQNLTPHADTITGNLINHGTSVATIPTIMTSFYNQAGDLLWVSNQLLPQSIRVQQSQHFHVIAPNLAAIKRVAGGRIRNFWVNGKQQPANELIIKTPQIPYRNGYVQLTVNPYVAPNGE